MAKRRIETTAIETTTSVPVSVSVVPALEQAKAAEKAAFDALSEARRCFASALPGQKKHWQLRVVQLSVAHEEAKRLLDSARKAEFASEFKALMQVTGAEALVRKTARQVWGLVPGVDMAAVEAAVFSYAEKHGGVFMGTKRGDVMFSPELKRHVAETCGMVSADVRAKNAQANKAYEAELAKQAADAAARLAREKAVKPAPVVRDVVALGTTPVVTIPARSESKDKTTALAILRQQWSDVLAECGGDKAAAVSRMGVEAVGRLVALVQWEREEVIRLAAEMKKEEEEKKRQEAALLSTLGELGL